MKTLLSILVLCASISTSVMAQENPSVDRAMRERVVEGVASRVEEFFYDSSQGREIATELRSNLASGAYDDGTDAAQLSGLLTATLSPYDNHFGVQYFGPQPQQAGGQAPQGAGGVFAAGPRDNYGFREVSILPGNVGYIDMRLFYPVQMGGDTAIAALNFVRNADAVIFDMRQNRGGTPGMVQLLISHFLDPNNPVTLNTFLASNRDYPGELLSLSYLPAGSRPDIPLYVLTSGQSGSAAEAFPYHLQAIDRATIVGETTAGAGNPGGYFPASDGFAVFVSVNQTRNPVTGTNWEGVGVVPDVAVPADDALDAALSLAYGAILETTEDTGQRQNLEWAREAIETRLNPPAITLSDYADIAGSYGPRTLFVEGDSIFYRRGAQGGRRLMPVGEDRFLVEGLDGYRLTIQRDRRGAAQSMTLQQAGGSPSTSARDS